MPDIPSVSGGAGFADQTPLIDGSRREYRFFLVIPSSRQNAKKGSIFPQPAG